MLLRMVETSTAGLPWCGEVSAPSPLVRSWLSRSLCGDQPAGSGSAAHTIVARRAACTAWQRARNQARCNTTGPGGSSPRALTARPTAVQTASRPTALKSRRGPSTARLQGSSCSPAAARRRAAMCALRRRRPRPAAAVGCAAPARPWALQGQGGGGRRDSRRITRWLQLSKSLPCP